MKIQQYFEAVGVKKEDKIQMVMIHLEGRALQWHQRLVRTRGSVKEMPWESYVSEMKARFHDDEFGDPMADLVSLKQTSTVEEFYDEFEALLNLLQLSEEYALSIFVSNLSPDISKSVRLFHPKTLTHALSLAKQMEIILLNPSRKPFLSYSKYTYSPPIPSPQIQPNPKPLFSKDARSLPGLLPTPRTTNTLTYRNTAPSYNTQQKPYNPANTKFTPVKTDLTTNKNARSPTKEERDERRRNGLCMWCGVKYVQGHNCLRSQLYHLLVEEPVMGEGESEELVDCTTLIGSDTPQDTVEGDTPVISLHALWGADDCKTMRVVGRIKKQSLVMLIDSGSTHNFIDQSVAKRLKCKTHLTAGLNVTVANGEVLKSQKACKAVIWESQGLLQTTDFLVLPLRGCDLVLGVQWLQTLGPITWDFTALTMQFFVEDKLVTLQGLQGGAVQIASKQQLSKLPDKRSPTTLLLV